MNSEFAPKYFRRRSLDEILGGGASSSILLLLCKILDINYPDSIFSRVKDMGSCKPKIIIDYDIDYDNIGAINIDHSSTVSYIRHKCIIDIPDSESEESQFTHKLNKSLDQIRENFNTSFYSKMDYMSNSPVTLSPNNSDSELSDSNSGSFSRNQIESTLDKYYDEEDTPTKHSSELDILITYLKGQKNLYIQAKNVTQYTLNSLLIPSLLITSAITIFAPFIQEYFWSGGFISGLNALSTVLITLVNYLKLESSVELFYHTANQYDKLETGLEFISSKLLFVENDKERSRMILEKIQDTEKKICEIKEWNTIFVPEAVRSMFPVICNINVFSLIKRIETYKRKMIIKLRDVKKEIRYITRVRRQSERSNLHESRMILLVGVKEKIKSELLCYKNAYQYMDDVFTREIKQAQCTRSQWFAFFQYKERYYDNIKNNPIIDKFLFYPTS